MGLTYADAVTERPHPLERGALEAILLVGGEGTRLRPLTLTTPKPLLPVAGVPFLTHQLATLRRAGVGHVVLATSYRAEVFHDTFGDGTSLGLSITYLHEEQPLGTGGAIRNASDGLGSASDDPVVILNGDVLSGHDLAGQIDFHRRVGADATLHLVEVDDARAYGCVPTDEENRVTAFLEKMPEPVTRWINAGAYVFRRSVIDTIPSGRVVSVERETFPQLLAEGRDVRAWKQSAYWCDVGTPEALVRCSADVVTGVAMGAGAAGAGDASATSASAWTAPGVVVPSDAVVDAGSSVGPATSLGAGCTVRRSIVMRGAVIGSGARLESSVVGAGATVGAGAVLVDVVLADGAVVEPGARPTPGSRLESSRPA